ncbi:tRNA-dihydrouridine synthase family protein [Helicobacter sp. MIT 05-5294]|uniref:tRNA dihydrouridine synthase n=1 Tax=Helicobacter sp. MIT 05-5294 TaxID=1548150 RepID=UPI0010FE0997|nr:tRNA-dihydrouridine synthase family protein [Helicobacter sp. MIT 05-5294]TLD87888.1 tRNA-dihydrouridine synthase family protein [Helicobacter sp. MIT 05-5294]
MLAPLAGYSDLPFREVVKKFGADITVSEMISVHALAFKNKKTLKMVEKSPLETPFALQIAGNEEGIITRAVESLNLHKQEIQILDLNCGCPAPKVSNHGSGSSLLKDLNKLVKILNLIRNISEIPYLSVKVRLGFDSKIPLEIANALKDAPIDYVVVHGRTKTDGYKKEKIDYDSIALMKQILPMPLIANGEIDSAQKSQEVLKHTGADGVMIGRAAVEKPWIFAQIKQGLQEESIDLRQRVSLEHFDRTISFRGDYGAIMFRKNLHAYSKGLKGSSEFRMLVNSISNPALMRQAILDFFSATTFEAR